MLKLILHPIRSARRLDDLERRMANLWITLDQDHQWLAGDETSEALTARYLGLVNDGWRSYPKEHITVLRKRLGLDPHAQEAKAPLSEQALQLCYAIGAGEASEDMTEASVLAADLERKLREIEGRA